MHILIAALAIAVIAMPAIAQDRAEDEGAIQSRVTALRAAIDQRDAAGYAALFTPDGDLILLGRPAVQGRSAIQATVERIWVDTPDQRGTMTPTSIRFVRSDIAIVNTEFRTTTTEVRGTLVMDRQDGVWLITALRVLPRLAPN